MARSRLDYYYSFVDLTLLFLRYCLAPYVLYTFSVCSQYMAWHKVVEPRIYALFTYKGGQERSQSFGERRIKDMEYDLSRRRWVATSKTPDLGIHINIHIVHF